MRRKDKLAPKRAGRLTAIVITRDMALFMAFAVLIFVFTVTLVSSLDDIRRMVYGVRPGVTLETRIISGYLPKEVRLVVEAMADQERTAPKDAMLYKETGELIPESPGLDIDVDLTVDRAMKAKPGGNVELVRTVIAPAITKRHFDPLYRVNTGRQAMAIAVNVAWGEDCLPRLLDALREHNMKVTFFIEGEWAEKFPDMVMLLSKEGHELANHGFQHVHVEKMSEPMIRQLISDNEKLLISLGVRPSRLFAPPYGECNQTVVSAAASLGYTTTMWTIDTLDWKLEDSEKVLDRVVPKITPGAIILAHPTEVFLEALPKIVDASRKAGYGFFTISDLLESE
ncbi:MAG: polysaccharide deacetylase family protein [Firmicutes bacterium]|jgi:peptidoglycan/xylan/chitin deacetylase (PgdA/CDA1 family)|nr:polysaccharide deacetylase family protein [Bacillota bacterium]